MPSKRLPNVMYKIDNTQQIRDVAGPNAGVMSATLAQQYTSIGWTSRVYRLCLYGNHGIFNQRYGTFGPAPQTLRQHWDSAGWQACVLVLFLPGAEPPSACTRQIRLELGNQITCSRFKYSLQRLVRAASRIQPLFKNSTTEKSARGCAMFKATITRLISKDWI